MRLYYFSYMIFFCTLISCQINQNPLVFTSDNNASDETQSLYNNLIELTQKGIMYGHQDDLAYGINWKFENGRSDIKEVCSDYPAVFGWDLGRIEKGSDYNLDSVPFSIIKKYIIEVFSRGGVNVVSWHANNPLTGGNTWDVSSKQVVKNILPGGQEHALYKNWLDKLSEFFLSLKSVDSTLVPIIFRPFHEFTGSWFWWGENLCTKQEFINLWQFTVKYLRENRKVHNLLYLYSSTDAFENTNEYLLRYPGDEYVDIFGFDSYQSPNISNNQFIRSVNNKLTMMSILAKERNKIAALSETGYEQIPDPEWWTQVLWKAVNNTSISYVLTWRNAYDRPNHYYGPYPGHLSANDFINFYKLPGTIFMNEVIKENLYEKQSGTGQ